DVDVGDSLKAVRIDTLPAAGALNLNGVGVQAGQIIAVAKLSEMVFTPVANANGNNYANFTFSVQDQANTFDTVPNTIVIDVTPVDDLPVISAGSGRVVESTQPSATGNLSATDVDNPSLAFVPAAHLGQYGSLSIDATGKWTYTLDNRAELLKEGEVRDESFTVTLNDG
ncbi:VCBS domain-containing protein, partial [Chitinimonas sp. PSY-7]|uniref:VCBS domain-containing protein n=1 Tax=Chitinimonas sp. PSY-7 TaxID=3459088 RepID=UPI00403FEC1F